MIIGQPKNVEEFQPLTPEEFAYLRQPLDQAIAQGVPLNQPAAVDLVILCRLLSTVVTLSRKLQSTNADTRAAEAAQPEPYIASMLGEPLPVEPETTVEEIASPDALAADASPPLPSLNLDPSRRVVLGEE